VRSAPACAPFAPDLLVGSNAVEAILSGPRVPAATLTGSEKAGRSIAAVAGRELKKTVLELGGSDPFVVLPTADLDRAAQIATTSRCQNNGQSCIAAKRFIVHTDVYDQFVDTFVAHLSALTVGDPMLDTTDVGPLATREGSEDVEAQVADAVDKGATVRCARPTSTRPPSRAGRVGRTGVAVGPASGAGDGGDAGAGPDVGPAAGQAR
jgi:succinate-semialdehyde dehydrogenase/glutarate-semialdehyde dehydrogenase